MKFVAACTDYGNFWELDGDVLSFRIVIQRGEEYFAVYPYFSRYTGEEEKQVRRLIAKGKEAYKEFVDKHFIKFVGVLPEDPVIHKKQVEAFPILREHMYQEGVQGIKALDPDQDDDDLSDSTIVEVPLTQDLYSPKFGREVPISVHHCMRLDEELFQMYDSSIQNTISENEISIQVDWDIVEQVYNAGVVSLKGYRIGGLPCNLENKLSWVGKVPFEHKYSAVDEVFKPVAVG